MTLEPLSVSQINAYIQNMMDRDDMLSAVAVRGEISNYKVYPSGHHYFTMKDADGALRCVMFRGNAIRLRFKPENGMQIIAMGKVSVYPRDGAYQLYCSAIVPDGVGDLYIAFEQLKAKLTEQGLFDADHKKALPQYPRRIGIVTSPAGAAVHDMLRILNKRYPICKVRIFPVRVQGAEAPAEIADAIRYANTHQLADLLIVGRGGGSIEDLWAFNSEEVAYAIYDSVIPVISAVGHEPDVTIADFVADLRAATPSNAAELAVPDQNALLQTLDSVQSAISIDLQHKIDANRKRLCLLAESKFFQNPKSYLSGLEQDLSVLKNRIINGQRHCISVQKERFVTAAARLDALSPLKVLSRGYALVELDNGAILRSAEQVKTGDALNITLQDGKLTATVTFRKENVL